MIKIDFGDCIGCKICEKVCPMQCIDISKGDFDPELCCGCMECIQKCPTNCITLDYTVRRW